MGTSALGIIYLSSRPALAAVAAFAVAVALLVSVSSTPTAEATIEDTAAGTGGPTSAGKNNGDTVYINNAEGTAYVRFEISTNGAAAASFTHADASDDGQSILCQADAACDANASTGVTVALKIDNDSGKGVIFVKQTDDPGQWGRNGHHGHHHRHGRAGADEDLGEAFGEVD